MDVLELDQQVCEQLPRREEMALVNLNLAIVTPVNVGIAFNVLSRKSIARVDGGQWVGLGQWTR